MSDIPNLDCMWADELDQWVDENPKEHSGVAAIAINLSRAKRLREADDLCDIPQALALERRCDRV